MHIAVKIGSRVISDSDGSLNLETFRNLVGQIASLIKSGHKVVLISSGAVSLGRSILPEKLTERQVDHLGYSSLILEEQILSSVGQPRLMSHYIDAFESVGLACAQLLTVRRDFAERRSYLSIREVTLGLLEEGVVPIFNENDTTAPETELDFRDNDHLALVVAAMIGADYLVILSSVQGILSDPTDPNSQVITTLTSKQGFVLNDAQKQGKGGMKTKVRMAKRAASLGINVVIANGRQSDVLAKAIAGLVGTTVPANDRKAKNVKSWISTAAKGKGRLVVSTYLAEALLHRRFSSILLAGVEQVIDDFEQKDIVDVFNDDGVLLGRGQTRYSSEQLRMMLRERESTSEEKESGVEVIHYDYYAPI